MGRLGLPLTSGPWHGIIAWPSPVGKEGEDTSHTYQLQCCPAFLWLCLLREGMDAGFTDGPGSYLRLQVVGKGLPPWACLLLPKCLPLVPLWGWT